MSSTPRSAPLWPMMFSNRILRAQLALQRAVLGLEAPVLDRLLDEPAHHVEVALSNGFSRYQNAPARSASIELSALPKPGHDDARQIGIDLVDLPHSSRPFRPGMRTSATTRSRPPCASSDSASAASRASLT
jgi:hypothetical protein